VPGRDMRQAVRGFDAENLEDVHDGLVGLTAGKKKPAGAGSEISWNGGYRWTRTTDLGIMSATL
jgi:hypothetical protein